jgi:2-methylcitrate dehydratase PrpD
VVDHLTERIVDTALEVYRADLSDKSVEMVSFAVLDLLACAVAGSRDESADRVRTWVERMGGTPEAQVYGTSVRAPAALAALANATASHALDFDDVSLRMIHPSATLVPAALAISERDHRTGAEMLAAYAAGFEVQARICASINPEHYARGWHTTGTVGVIGAATAAGLLLGLDRQQLSVAVGIAAASAKGIRKNFGSMVKPLHAGHAAMHGVEAAELAALGFSADEAVFDGANGYVHVFTTPEGGERLLEAFAPGAPMELETSGIGIKRFACCGAIHPALDAMEAIMEKSGVRPDDVERIECRVNELAPAILVHHDAQTGLEGKFSMEYSLAVYLLHGRAGLAQYTDEAAQDPRLRQLMSRVDVVVDTELPVDLAYFASVVSVETRDGSRHTERVDVQRGYPERPFTVLEMTEKARGCCADIVPKSAVDELVESVTDLKSCRDVATIAGLLKGGDA